MDLKDRRIEQLEKELLWFKKREGSLIIERESLKKEIIWLKKALREAESLFITDDLTGVLNRRGFCGRLEAFFKEAFFVKKNHCKKRRFQVDSLSVVFFDTDGFKETNDNHGHSKGDDVLKTISEQIKDEIRSLDFVGRYGGDEFVVGLPGATEEEAFVVAEKIRGKVENIFLKIGVTLSIGVASVQKTNAKHFLALIDYADKAMYEAKKNRGKNNTVRYSEISE